MLWKDCLYIIFGRQFSLVIQFIWICYLFYFDFSITILIFF